MRLDSVLGDWYHLEGGMILYYNKKYDCQIKMCIILLILMQKMRNRYRWIALEEGFRSVPVRGSGRKYEESYGQIIVCIFCRFSYFWLILL